MSVKGKVVIITGAAMGIGRYNARLFAAEGAKLALADIASMESVVKEVEDFNAEVLPITADITDEEQVRALMEQVNRHYGRIDVLINDAAIVTHFQSGAPRWPRIKDMESSFFDKVMRTNLMGTFHTTKHVLPYMEAQDSGCIINFGQGTVRNEAQPDSIGAAVYSVSKVSIRAFTKQVALEEKDYNICIVSMGPGGADAPTPPAERLLRGIATDETPEEKRGHMRWVADVVQDRYILAAEAPVELSGNQITVRDGELVVTLD